MKTEGLKGKWDWKELFSYGEVIHFWGIWPPSLFWKASQDDRAFAVAFYEAKMGMQAWEAHVANLKHQAETANLSNNKD